MCDLVRRYRADKVYRLSKIKYITAIDEARLHEHSPLQILSDLAIDFLKDAYPNDTVDIMIIMETYTGERPVYYQPILYPAMLDCDADTSFVNALIHLCKNGIITRAGLYTAIHSPGTSLIKDVKVGALAQRHEFCVAGRYVQPTRKLFIVPNTQ